MSFGIQTQTSFTLSDLSLFATESEETAEQEGTDSSLEAKGGLKTPAKTYSFTTKETTTSAKALQSIVQTFSFKSDSANKAQFFEQSPLMSQSSFYRPAAGKQARGQEKSASTEVEGPLNAHKESTQETVKHSGKEEHFQTGAFKQAACNATAPHAVQHAKMQTRSAKEGMASADRLQSRSDQRQEKAQSLATRQWTKEEPKEWWETRYHQRERQGGHSGRDQGQHHEEKEKKLGVSKSANVASKNASAAQLLNENGPAKMIKPELAPPKIGVFALYYILTKMGIFSDGTSNYSYKKEIEYVDAETTETHKKRLDEIKESIKKEKETERWGVAVKVFSWIASLFGIVAGIALIATGVGAIAGAMMIAGGVIQITNQIMELTGGWQKVAELLPGDDTEKKRAVLSWMQIGIAVLCLILSGAGVIWGGFSNFGEAMQTAMGVVGGIAAMGYGVTTIGEGISGFFYKNRLADVKQFDIRLAQLKHMRRDLMDKVELGVDRLEQLFEGLARSLEFDEELFQADQMINRR